MNLKKNYESTSTLGVLSTASSVHNMFLQKIDDFLPVLNKNLDKNQLEFEVEALRDLKNVDEQNEVAVTGNHMSLNKLTYYFNTRLLVFHVALVLTLN